MIFVYSALDSKDTNRLTLNLSGTLTNNATKK